jgi:cobyrinic acid a,c-diamide synthase
MPGRVPRDAVAHILISAARKSSGKTTLSIGLAAALAERGLAVQAFKKGPDYIDPMWLARATGRPCFNLDFNTQTNEEILATFSGRGRGADLSVIEGNKGLYDGMDVEGSDASAALAKLLQSPVLLVLDASGITRGIAPLVLGYRTFDPHVAIRGVILNNVLGPRHERKLRQALERYTDVEVLGAIGRDEAMVIAERHLGLTTPGETAALDERIGRIARRVSDALDLDRVIEIARGAPAPAPAAPAAKPQDRADVRLGIARDKAFGFYYPDDLEALERAGAELVFFDTLTDSALPVVDGLFIGALRSDIRGAIEGGLPTYAECGGLMYLCRSISWDDERREMVGVVPADAVMHGRPQGRGLVQLEETGVGPWPLPAERPAPPIRAHEFHYAALENLGPGAAFAYRVKRGHGIDGAHDGIVISNLLATFSHLRDTAANHWAGRFVGFVRDCKNHRENAAPATAVSLSC